ncbi:MAG: hypothetical protein M9932_03145 [Xanthobacteraceae bacterium]|nr:hypothetical protein [Xanthobacteraceae bacterium]
MPRILLLLALLAPLSTPAMAQKQSPSQRGGTEAEQKACTRDVTRHCRHLMDQGDLVILSCLKEHRSKLTKACEQVLASHGQ